MNNDKVFLKDPIFFTRLEEPFSYQTYAIIESTIQVFATGPLAIAGIVSNTINIVIFYRQGIFSNSSTVSLTALAISDFLSCFFCVWSAICGFLLHFVDQSNFKFEVIGMRTFTSVRPINLTTQITCWITAFAAFERCFSVVFPFKVKSIFSPKRSLAVAICIFVGSFLMYIPIFIEERAVWEINPFTNVSFIGWTPTGLTNRQLSTTWNYINPIALRFLTIFIVVLCNTIIFWKVNLSQKFRKTSANKQSTASTPTTVVAQNLNSSIKDGDNDDQQLNNSTCKNAPKPTANENSTSKEMKLLRMITMVSIVFTVCYTVYIVFTVLFFLVWRWNIDYHWYFHFIGFGVTQFFQILNSSTNTIIYYTMSSRFREELRLCCAAKSRIASK